MPPRKKPEHAASLKKNKEENQTLEKLEAGLCVKIGDKTINELYNEKLNNSIDLKETMSKTLSKPQPKPKVQKPVKELTEKGRKASERLSKYRTQVKEALELKKTLESRNLISYSDDEDEEDPEEPEVKPIQPVQPASIIPEPVIQPKPIIQQPQIDLGPIYNEIETLKKKNKEIEDRFMYRNAVMDISNMRRNMSIKF